MSAALTVAASLIAASAASAAPATPFTQCPAIGADTSCGLLIVFNANGTTSVFQDGTQGPYDGGDDTLVGVQNNSNVTVFSVTLSSTTQPIFGFEADGLCTASGAPAGCPFGPTGYEGPNTSFTVVDNQNGTVNFPQGLPAGQSTYFSLEEALDAADVNIGPGVSLATQVSSGSTSVGGGGVTDTAILAGTNGGTGNIAFNVYGPDDPTCTGDPFFVSSAGVDGNAAYASLPFYPGLAGTYSFVATYSGDANNATISTACNDPAETVVVSPKLTTQASASVAAGQTIHDTATLSGGRSPSGNITFSLYGPDDVNCSRTPVFIVDAPVQNGNGTYLSREFTTSAAGTYRWIARYNGDSLNPPVETACNDPLESVAVTTGAPPIVVVPAHSTSHARFKVAYARYVKPRAGRSGYLSVRVNSKRAQHVRLRIKLSAKHWSGQNVTRTIRTNRAVKLRGLHLIGAQKVRVVVLG